MEERYQSLLSRYQSRENSDFVSDFVHLSFYKCHKIHFKPGGPNSDSPGWIKSKTAIINLINKKCNKCFQDAVTVALNHEEA